MSKDLPKHIGKEKARESQGHMWFEGCVQVSCNSSSWCWLILARLWAKRYFYLCRYAFIIYLCVSG